MKKITWVLSILIVVITIFSSCAPRVVVAKPPVAVVTRPAPPGPRYVWVDGNYIRSGRTYVYRPGYYAIPPRGKVVYKPGYWVRRGNGYYWRNGRW